MKRLLVPLCIAAFAVSSAAGPVTAADISVQVIRNFPSVVAVKPPTARDFPNNSLMRANCKWLYRVVQPNGSSIETEKCRLSDEPVMVPEFQGSVPRHRVVYGFGKCVWHSDYWGFTAGQDVLASSVRVLVTPRGEVYATSKYPRVPLVCPAPS
jgi:hypothetical protein